MDNLTWKQFKEIVESQGAKDSDEVGLIDWNGVGGNPKVEIYKTKTITTLSIT